MRVLLFAAVLNLPLADGLHVSPLRPAAARTHTQHTLACRPTALNRSANRVARHHMAAAEAAEDSAPTPRQRLGPGAQLLLLLPLYALHVAWLSQVTLQALTRGRAALPLALAEIGGENVVGAAVLLCAAPRWLRRRSRGLPWADVRVGKVALISTVGALVAAYLLSGYVGSVAELAVYALAAAGAPLTESRHRAVQVLAGHLAWVVMAVRVLGDRLRPFFPPPFGRGEWITLRWRTLWLPSVLGGYFVSLLAYNSVAHVSAALLPTPELAPESVVSRLISPEGGDVVALGIGSIGPCLTAPVFEEVLYRGFLLPALLRFVPLRVALPLQAALFGAHHHSLKGLLPLSALGLLWGILYVSSGNLLVPILIHALWNSRIFLSSYLGLGGS